MYICSGLSQHDGYSSRWFKMILSASWTYGLFTSLKVNLAHRHPSCCYFWKFISFVTQFMSVLVNPRLDLNFPARITHNRRGKKQWFSISLFFKWCSEQRRRAMVYFRFSSWDDFRFQCYWFYWPAVKPVRAVWAPVQTRALPKVLIEEGKDKR